MPGGGPRTSLRENPQTWGAQWDRPRECLVGKGHRPNREVNSSRLAQQLRSAEPSDFTAETGGGRPPAATQRVRAGRGSAGPQASPPPPAGSSRGERCVRRGWTDATLDMASPRCVRALKAARDGGASRGPALNPQKGACSWPWLGGDGLPRDTAMCCLR